MDSLDLIPKNQHFVIWGLRHTNHSHRYIHLGFYRTLKRHGFQVTWLDDKASAVSQVPEKSVMFVADVASKHIPIRSDLSYVAHNLEKALTEKLTAYARQFLTIQVWTRRFTGEIVEGQKVVAFDSSSRTLFQPWGTPWEQHEWAEPKLMTSRFPRSEFWIGSVWSNNQNQGNFDVIRHWKNVLYARGVRFLNLPRGWPDSPGFYFPPVRASSFGASIVGTWQKENEYFPCRVFKNLSAGVLASGNNLGYKKIFGDFALVDQSLETLADRISDLSPSDKREMIHGARELLANFTYKSSLERIIHFLGS